MIIPVGNSNNWLAKLWMINYSIEKKPEMRTRAFLIIVIIALIIPNVLTSQTYEGKYKEANYTESEVPEYVLPDILTSFDNIPIENIGDWKKKRRPEIIDFFANNIYGIVPNPSYPIKKSFEVISEDSNYIEGLCTRKEIKITITNELGEVSMPLVQFIPNQFKKPVPAIFIFNGDDIRKNRLELDGPQKYGMTKNGIPLIQLMEKGIALITIDGNAMVSKKGFVGGKINGGIIDLFFKPGQKFTKENEWGLIAVWAHAMTVGMDYIVTNQNINSDQVAVLGTSVNGKVALWAAANDQRIGMVLLATTGHGGDSIWRRQFGETLENMCNHLPSWICRNANLYANDVNSLPVDQHTLLATIAPRPLYVATAETDLWADHKGQWISAYHAAEAYELYDKKVAFTSPNQPPLDQPIVESSIGFHLRSGYHGLSYYDWARYMEFMEYHFMKED